MSNNNRPLTSLAFFHIQEWSDSCDRTVWIRSAKADSGQLWEARFARPKFSEKKINNKVLTVNVKFMANGAPAQIETPWGQINLRNPIERHAPPTSSHIVPNTDWELTTRLQDILEEDEKALWSSAPGIRAVITTSTAILIVLAVISVFFFYWVRMSSLCYVSTPPSWQWPCYGFFGVGSFALFIPIVRLVKKLRNAFTTHGLTQYVVTDRRALVIVNTFPKKIIYYEASDVYFADIRRRKLRSTVYFRTKQEPYGNFWDVRGGELLEPLLSAIIQRSSKLEAGK